MKARNGVLFMWGSVLVMGMLGWALVYTFDFLEFWVWNPFSIGRVIEITVPNLIFILWLIRWITKKMGGDSGAFSDSFKDKKDKEGWKA